MFFGLILMSLCRYSRKIYPESKLAIVIQASVIINDGHSHIRNKVKVWNMCLLLQASRTQLVHPLGAW